MAIVHEHGMLLYLDLIHYIFRLNAHKLAESTHQNYNFFDNDDLAAFRAPTFKFVIFCTVKDLKQIPYKPVWDATAKMSKDLSLNNFEMFVSASKSGEWDETYLKTNVPSGAKRIYLSTSVDAEEKTQQSLRTIGFAQDVITVLSCN